MAIGGLLLPSTLLPLVVGPANGNGYRPCLVSKHNYHPSLEFTRCVAIERFCSDQAVSIPSIQHRVVGQVPLLEIDGIALTQSHTILRYVLRTRVEQATSIASHPATQVATTLLCVRWFLQGMSRGGRAGTPGTRTPRSE